MLKKERFYDICNYLINNNTITYYVTTYIYYVSNIVKRNKIHVVSHVV